MTLGHLCQSHPVFEMGRNDNFHQDHQKHTAILQSIRFHPPEVVRLPWDGGKETKDKPKPGCSAPDTQRQNGRSISLAHAWSARVGGVRLSHSCCLPPLCHLTTQLLKGPLLHWPLKPPSPLSVISLGLPHNQPSQGPGSGLPAGL